MLILVGVSLASTPAARAHHSQSEYDLRAKVEVEGTVTKLEWKSPHGWMYVDVTNDEGRKSKLELRAAEPEHVDAPRLDAGLAETRRPRQGGGAPARNFPTIAIANSIKDGNGKPLFTGTTQIYEPEAQTKGAE